MKYIVWGIGERFIKNIHNITLEDVICFVDKKAGEGLPEYYGKPLIIPEKILNYEYDYIVVSSNKYFDEIAEYCIFKLGVDCKRIVCLDYLLNREKKTLFDSNVQLKYRDVAGLIMDCDRAAIVKNWMRKDILDYPIGNDVINYGGYIFDVPTVMPSISIYQVTHKKFRPIGNSRYSVIGVGAGELPYSKDNIGDNIAEYNEKINECTALYWIWKHSEAEYIGLNHYRRVFESELNAGWPIQYVEALLLLQKYDVIVLRAVSFYNNTVKSMLGKEICREAFEKSWEVLSDLFHNKSDEEKEAFELIMNGSIMFPCNMFIMDRAKVNEYCSWLFPILFELIEKVEIKEEWDTYSKRVIGFWAERMFTVWLYFSNYKVKELSVLSIGDCKPYGK